MTVFQGKQGYVVLDQLRTADQSRLVRRLGILDAGERDEVLRVLSQMFAP